MTPHELASGWLLSSDLPQAIRWPSIRSASPDRSDVQTDRVLWVGLSRLWSNWQQALAFVRPRTGMAWQKIRGHDHGRRLRQSGTPGRPAVAQAGCERIQAMGKAHPSQSKVV